MAMPTPNSMMMAIGVATYRQRNALVNEIPDRRAIIEQFLRAKVNEQNHH